MGKGGLVRILFKLFKRKKSMDKKKKNKAKKQQQTQGFAVQPLQHNIQQNGQVGYRPATAQQYQPVQGGYYPPPQQQQQAAYYQQSGAPAPSQAQRPSNAAVNGIIAGHVAGIAYEMSGHKGSRKTYETAAKTGVEQYNKWQQKQQSQGQVPVASYGAPAA